MTDIEKKCREIIAAHSRLQSGWTGMVDAKDAAEVAQAYLNLRIGEDSVATAHFMSLRRNSLLHDEIAKLEAENAELKEALRRIASADCPNYVAHPQSVWWEIHFRDKARDLLVKYELPACETGAHPRDMTWTNKVR